jgi:hypothetical protein
MIFRKANNDMLFQQMLKDNQLIHNCREWAKSCDWEESAEDPSNSFIDDIPDERILALTAKHVGGLHNLRNL